MVSLKRKELLMIKTAIVILVLTFTVLAQSTPKELSKKLRDVQAKGHLPGFAVAIVNDDGVLYRKGFGYADLNKKTPYTADTAQPIGSISKTFVGLALMKAVDEGKLSLETNINDVLPFKVYNPNFPKQEIKIKHLTNHSSGIVDRWKTYESTYVKAKKSEVTLKEFFIDYFTPKGKFYHPENFSKERIGAKYEYSNIGSALAAYIVELKTGMSFSEYTKKKIFNPLKMWNTSWFYDGVKFHAKLYDKNKKPIDIYSLTTYPDGGLRTNVRDLGKYMLEMTRGARDKSEFLSKSSFETLFTGQYSIKKPPKELDPSKLNFGVFWTVRPSGTIGHDGSDPGVSTFLYFNRKSGYGRIFVVNTDLEENKAAFDDFLEVWKSLNEYAKVHKSKG